MQALGSLQFFSDPRLAFARDAWVGTRLASVTAADAVRLCPDPRPDYEERVGEQITQYEITEAMLPGRRRGEEYKQAAARGQVMLSDGPVGNWIARAEKVPEALRAAAENKARKAYVPTTRLVIYLNISEFGIRSTEIRAALGESTAPATEAFDQVLVLWVSTCTPSGIGAADRWKLRDFPQAARCSQPWATPDKRAMSVSEHWSGPYRDDRIYEMRITKGATRQVEVESHHLTETLTGPVPTEGGWVSSVLLITYRNVPSLPAVRTDTFKTFDEAVEYVRKVEPTCPRVSLGGQSPTPAPSWEEHLDWLHHQNLRSAAEGDQPQPEWRGRVP